MLQLKVFSKSTELLTIRVRLWGNGSEQESSGLIAN